MARGERRRSPPPEVAFQTHEAWQREVLQRLRLGPQPAAPVTALGAGLLRDRGCWLQAQFVHLAAGLDHLVLVPLVDAQALDASAQRELQSHLATLVREDGYDWLSAADEHFLYTTASIEAETCAPEAAARLPLVDAMPRGEHGRNLRRLMTELQMQLHEHPVNQQRERAGLLPANGVWLWGLGAQVINARTQLPNAFSDDAFVRGLYRSHGQTCQPLPRDGQSLITQAAGEVLLLLHCGTLQELDERWLAPLEHAVNTGRIQQLELLLDDMHLTATRWHRWRWWRAVRRVV